MTGHLVAWRRYHQGGSSTDTTTVQVGFISNSKAASHTLLIQLDLTVLYPYYRQRQAMTTHGLDPGGAEVAADDGIQHYLLRHQLPYRSQYTEANRQVGRDSRP